MRPPVSIGSNRNELRRMSSASRPSSHASLARAFDFAQPVEQRLRAPPPARRPSPCAPSRCRAARRSRRCARGSWRSRGSTGRTAPPPRAPASVVSTVISRSALRTRLAGGAADDHLPAAFLADEADVLDRGLGAVARAADGGHLHLVRREELLEAPLHLDAGAGRVLRAEAAELGADAGLHHAHALGVRLARRHAEVGPDLRAGPPS